MNKLIATIALAALAFTSCIKENDTWKEMLPVQPGMYIYQLATDQDKLAMRPANAALRLAMLLAEADKQGEDVLSADLKEIVVKKGDASIKVWETLFGAHTKLERQGEDYLITYSDEAQLPDRFFMAGSVLVKTNGTKVLNQSSYSAPWTVEMQDLKVFAYTNTGLRSAFNFDGGETTLYFDGADSYIIGASSFRIHLDNVDASSNWTGRYTLRAEDSSLAYSLCSGKDFKVEGGASGPTLYSSDMTQAVGMGYELTNGVYRGMQIISGTQECRFLSPLEYDTTKYPASSVTYEWSYDSSTNTVFQKIRYNGYVCLFRLACEARMDVVPCAPHFFASAGRADQGLRSSRMTEGMKNPAAPTATMIVPATTKVVVSPTFSARNPVPSSPRAAGSSPKLR